MQPRRRLRILTGGLAVAALLWLPAAASATPQWLSNGRLVGTEKQGVVQFGTLTLGNSFVGEWKCGVLEGVPVWNEGGNGFASVDGWRTYNCSAASCPGAAVVTAENPVELINEGSEKYKPLRRPSTLPWPAETVAPEVGVARLKVSKIKLFLDCPAEAVEIGFSGSLEPQIVNGTKNGLSPSHLDFEGKGGKTGSLICTPLGPPPCGSEGGELFVSGDLTMLGTGQQLITAR
jgi:hypothetical protein